MRIPGRKTATRHLRRLRGRLGPRAVLLGYHRVAEDPWDPFSLCVSPANFAAHLDVVRNLANPIGLSDLVRGLDAGRIPPRAVVVTFDDGYADALHTARPLLELAGVPAAVFVITGMIGEEPWWDELARWVRAAPASAPEHLPEAAHASAPGERLRALHGALRPLGGDDRAEAMARIREALADGSSMEDGPAGPKPADEAAAEGSRRCLDADELRELARSELIEVGAHGHTHLDLASRPPVEQRREIETSKAALEELVSRRVTGFSYPHGSFGSETRRIVRGCGFESACGSTPDLARSRSDRFALPRLFVSDVDGESFARWLTSWLGR